MTCTETRGQLQIVKILRQIESFLADGLDVEAACREVNISKLTYYRWKKKFADTSATQLKRLKQFEKENARLKKLVAELSLDKDILHEALKGKW